MRHPIRPIAAFASIVIVTSTGGCTWKNPEPVREQKFDPAGTAALDIAPKDLVQRVQTNLPTGPLAIPIASIQDGVILTDWKEYEGELHIVRRWRERTRFKINILPDFKDPLTKSHVEVFDETEEKPSDGQPWYPNPDLRRQSRSNEVIKAIQAMK